MSEIRDDLGRQLKHLVVRERPGYNVSNGYDAMTQYEMGCSSPISEEDLPAAAARAREAQEEIIAAHKAGHKVHKRRDKTIIFI